MTPDLPLSPCVCWLDKGQLCDCEAQIAAQVQRANQAAPSAPSGKENTP